MLLFGQKPPIRGQPLKIGGELEDMTLHLHQVLAGTSVADSAAEDLPVVLAAVVDPLTAHLSLQAGALPTQVLLLHLL